MSNPSHLLADTAIDEAHLSLEELDRFHANVKFLSDWLTDSGLVQKLPDALIKLLIHLEQTSFCAIEKTHDPALHYDASGQLRACPACGGLRITFLTVQNNRPCCKGCGLPCALYDAYRGNEGDYDKIGSA
jgi:hypothetical protein